MAYYNFNKNTCSKRGIDKAEKQPDYHFMADMYDWGKKECVATDISIDGGDIVISIQGHKDIEIFLHNGEIKIKSDLP